MIDRSVHTPVAVDEPIGRFGQVPEDFPQEALDAWAEEGGHRYKRPWTEG